MKKIELVIKNFVDTLAGRDIALDEELLESGILDSFSFVELIEVAERELGISIDFTMIERDKFKTINNITETLEKM
jgi:D-alanine--poly(phosphoribitol) ligase subunit 2